MIMVRERGCAPRINGLCATHEIILRDRVHPATRIVSASEARLLTWFELLPHDNNCGLPPPPVSTQKWPYFDARLTMAWTAYSGRVSLSVNYQLEIFHRDFGDWIHAIRQIAHFAYSVKQDSKESSLREQIYFFIKDLAIFLKKGRVPNSRFIEPGMSTFILLLLNFCTHSCHRTLSCAVIIFKLYTISFDYFFIIFCF
jgi:hypothetical protein